MAQPVLADEGDSTSVALTDGGIVQLRPISPADACRLVSFHLALSDESRYFRFFSPHPRLSDAEVERFTHVDTIDRVALVAVTGDEIIAVGRFDRRPGADDAEVAFVVADGHHRRGIASALLAHLAAAARERGLTRLTAEVLPNNRAMLGVFAASGLRRRTSFVDGVAHVEMAL